MMKLLWAILFLVPVIAQSENVTAEWINPTTYVDGTPLPLADIISTRLEYGTCTLLNDGIEMLQGGAVSPGNDETETFNVPPGDYCLLAYTTEVNSLESGPSNAAMTTVAAAAPSPPTGFTVVESNLLVYTLIQSLDRLALVPVGTVPSGTMCDSSQGINGKFVVPLAVVDWVGTVRPEVVVADCA